MKRVSSLRYTSIDRICASMQTSSAKSSAPSTSTSGPTTILPPTATATSNSSGVSTAVEPALVGSSSSSDGLVNRSAPAPAPASVAAAAAAVASIAQDLTGGIDAEEEPATGSGASTPGGSEVMTPVKGGGGSTKVCEIIG